MPATLTVRELEALGFDARASMASGVATRVSAAEAKKTREPRKTYGIYKSSWEADYADRLAIEQRAGLIARFEYEAHSYIIGIGAKYTPDFAVWLPDGTLEEREVKGHWREAARVRIKSAARQYPGINFRVITKLHGAWANPETFRG